ncbi:hypothetical protein V2W45_1345796 [Cenococcum geophilum]
MDRIVSVIMGQPLAIREEDIDLRLPQLEHGHEFYAGMSGVETDDESCRTRIFAHSQLPLYSVVK